MTPENLYKYLSSSRAQILEDGLIRFTQPSDLNDPFEFRMILKHVYTKRELKKQVDEILEQELQQVIRTLPKQYRNQFAAQARGRASLELRPQIEKAMAEALRFWNNQVLPQAASKVLGVLSLSEDPLNLLMWAHYAQSHTGFVIQLSTKSDFFALPSGVHEEFGRLHKVKYSNDRVEFDISANETSIALDMLCTKPLEWSYEREWRLVRPLESCDKRMPRQQFDTCLFRLPRDAVRRVFVGDRMVREDFEKIASALGATAYFNEAKLFGVRMQESKFALEYFPAASFDDLMTDEKRGELGRQIVAEVEAEREKSIRALGDYGFAASNRRGRG